MARSKDAKSTTPRAPKRPSRLRAFFGNRARILNALTSLVILAICGTVLATMVVGQKPLVAKATQLRTAKLAVAFDWPPLAGKSTSRSTRADAEPATWMNREMRSELENMALKLLNGDPFDGKALQRTQEALKQTGWFAEGPWLKRHENGVVVITGKWRIPVAAVRSGDKDRLVASGGELLVPEYPAGRSGFKTILGAGSPPASLGEPWPGSEVQAGIALINFLRPMPGFDQVESIDTSSFSEAKRLSILTNTGGRIIWGAPPFPGQFTPGQASASARRDRLASVHQRFGTIDAGRSLIDVRPEDGVYLQDDAYLARNTTVMGNTAKK